MVSNQQTAGVAGLLPRSRLSEPGRRSNERNSNVTDIRELDVAELATVEGGLAMLVAVAVGAAILLYAKDAY